MLVLRTEVDRTGAPAPPAGGAPHAGLEFVDDELTNRDDEDPDAMELRELLRETPPVPVPVVASPPLVAGDDDEDAPESLSLLLVLVPRAPGVPGLLPRPEALAFTLLGRTEEPPERKGGGVLRCGSSLLGVGLFAASIATRGKPPLPEGRLGFGVPPAPVAPVSVGDDGCW